jgi:hypothetical protein
MPEDIVVTDAQPWESLGYDTFELYVAAKDTEQEDAKAELTVKLETAQGQIDTDQLMIQRQGNELGALRKLKDGKEMEVPADTKDVDAIEAQYKEKNIKREAALTAEQVVVLDEAYTALSDKDLVSTEEGRSEFMNLILGENSTVKANTFTRPVPEKKLSLAEKLKLAVEQVDSGARPAVTKNTSGVQMTKTSTTKKQTARPMASARTGDVRSMLKDITESE